MDKAVSAKHFFNAKVITFNSEQSNGTGYYDGAAEDELPEIEVNGYFRTIDPGTNRRILGLKIEQGKNLVLFERYSQCSNSPFVLVCNKHYKLKIEGFSSAITEEEFDRFIQNFQ